MARKDEVYILGHRNPDTDSICSAIAYADIKNRTEKGKFIPMRAGQINEETEFVLKYFNVETPGYLPDAATQVDEIEIHKVEGVSGDISVKEAWNKMNDQNVVTLPITTPENRLEGLITVSDIAKSYMDVYDSNFLAQAKTSYKSIADTLDGKIVCGDEKGIFDDGRVVVGAFHPDMMSSFIKKNDLVILGNRAEDQLFCLDLGVRCMVIGLDAHIGSSIQRLATENGCTIISSPHDTYTIARLINQSIPIRHLMVRDKLLTFHLTDKVTDIEDVMKNSRHRNYPVLDAQDHYVGTISRRNLIGRRGKRLILVDHNEKSQAVLNVDQAEILEIIDHHRLGSLETSGPIMFRNQPVGCTATIMTQIYHERELEIPPKIAGLLCSAIISDTLLFRSPTCTEKDKAAATELAEIAGIKDIRKYASAMFRAGSNLEEKSPDEIFYQDFKKFIIEKATFGVGQISSMDAEELDFIKDKLLPHLQTEVGKHDIKMVFFMLTNIIDESTELLYYGDGAKKLVQDAFPAQADKASEESCVLPGVVSRKKQLIPSFMTALQQQ